MKIPGSNIFTKNKSYGIIPRLGFFVCILIYLTTGCSPFGTSPTEAERPLASYSLLLHAPLVGNETEVRDPALNPTRMLMGSSSVEGWLLPAEAMLRFPVDIREGARISFRIGAKTSVSIHLDDLTFKVEYVPDENSAPTETDENGQTPAAYSTTLFEASPSRTPRVFAGCFDMWYTVDISLETWAPGKGEIIFSAEGPLAGNPGIDLMFGQPVIYYPEEMRHKNVLLIGVDTLRQDSLTPYGARDDLTPFLQEFSQSATVFTQARSQAPWTLPSFASMVTGELPSQIGATIYTGYLPYRNTTIGEMLRDSGYTTATICSNTWLGNDQSGFDQGMDEIWFEYNATAAASVDIAKDFIARSSERDWFCFLHFFDPHVPYSPVQENFDKFTDPNYSGELGNSFGAIEEWKSGLVTPSEADLNHVIGLYNGEVASVDAALGDLFAFLVENGLSENTLVIFAADHGEEFFDHGGFEHGHTQFDELVLMPLIVRGTGFTEGARIDEITGNTDIVPTILEYAGLGIPESLVGEPLQQVVAGEQDPERIIFGEDNSRGPLRKFGVLWPYKCIVDFVNGDILLYDLENDPGEAIDVREAHSDLVEHLSREIVAAMLPDQTAFHVWITRGYHEGARRFSGTITLPDGISDAVAFRLEGDDTYTIEGNTITFSVSSATYLLGPNKHIMIIPSEGSETMEVSILVEGSADHDRFYPYGNRTPEPSGTATVRIDDFPPGTSLPLAIEEYPAGCYLWAQRGYDRNEDTMEMDEETREQLRALGYIDD